MRQTTLAYSGSLLAIPLLLAHCGSGTSSDDDGGKHNGGSSGMATSGAAGKAMSGGTSNGGTGGATTGGSAGSGAAGKASGGTGGTSGGTGGASGSTGGGSGSGTGATGPASGGSGGSTTGGSGGTGGSMGGTGPAGAGGSGGTAGGAGMAGAANECPDTDTNGKANWMPGATANGTRDYLRSCDIRLINNNWGAVELGCSSDKNQYNVFVNSDGSFGWNFNRGDCDTASSNQKPDFPEVEFGVHPFGKGSSLATTPDFSSTTLLPIQIKDLKSASVTINNFNIQLQQSTSWDITFEFWITDRNPLTDSSPGVHAELMTFWGWQNGRYPEPPNGMGPVGNGAGDQVSAGKQYKLEVQSDSWGSGWHYYQFRMTDGPSMSFSGKVDVKPLVDYLMGKGGYSSDAWVSRFEVGSEIDDLTQGKVTIDSIAFEVNGTTRSAGKK